METKRIILLAIASIVVLFTTATSCTKTTEKQQEAKVTKTLPEGAVPFEYDENMLRLIFLNGIVNDSIRLKVFFDTGAHGLTLPSQYQEVADGETPTIMQIGKWKRSYKTLEERDALPEGHHLEKILGSNTAIVGWDFFDRKIIEISYKNKYIRELADTENLSSYDTLKISIDEGAGVRKLGIPITAIVQGKEINVHVTIDTGANGSVTFNEDIASRYHLELNTMDKKATNAAQGKVSGFTLVADTIHLGRYSVTDHNVAFVGKGGPKRPFSGLLGAKVLEKFDIILDLKNYRCYFKPLNLTRNGN